MKEARLDVHVPNLIQIPPNTPSFGTHSKVLDGSLIIQDKASCIPSLILSEGWQPENKYNHVIDACAAPGNKTLHD